MKILKNITILFILMAASNIQSKTVRILIFNHMKDSIFCKYKNEVKNICRFFGTRSIDIELEDDAENIEIFGNCIKEFKYSKSVEVLKHSLFLNSDEKGIELLRELHIILHKDKTYLLPAFEYYAWQAKCDLSMNEFFKNKIQPIYDYVTTLSKKEN